MLKDLIHFAEEVVGFQATNSETRAQLVLWINRAAEELWDRWDLPNSLMEQTFYLGDAATDTTIWRVTLPWYVGTIRAARFSQAMDALRIQDLRPRYFNRPWKQPLLTWRLIGQTPLLRELSEDTTLSVVRGDESVPFTVSIRGATGGAQQVVETITFLQGGAPELITSGATNEDNYLTQNQWVHDNPIGIDSITKDAVTQNDVTIYDLSDNVVATIPNRLLRANNSIIQLHDDSKSIFNSTVEVLFKLPYIPFYFDTDEFKIPQLETAITWVLRSNWYSTKEGKINESVAALQRATDLVQNVCGRIEEATERRVKFAPDPFELAPLKSYPFRYGRRS